MRVRFIPMAALAFAAFTVAAAAQTTGTSPMANRHMAASSSGCAANPGGAMGQHMSGGAMAGGQHMSGGAMSGGMKTDHMAANGAGGSMAGGASHCGTPGM